MGVRKVDARICSQLHPQKQYGKGRHWKQESTNPTEKIMVSVQSTLDHGLFSTQMECQVAVFVSATFNYSLTNDTVEFIRSFDSYYHMYYNYYVCSYIYEQSGSCLI